MSTKQPKKAVKSESKSLKISARARYALRILKDIADHQDDDLATTEHAIAERQGLSVKFLSRIVLPLRDAGLVSAQRGSRAGFRLLKDPKDITLLEILETTQGRVSILDCLDPAIDCPRERGCFAHRVWGRANRGLRDVLAAITLAD